ncbi:MAG: 3-hydroxyacyl-ACP dehydratase FabZ [Rhodospirillales bacterium]|jgi:3-hydroxyacyl-[acyl-carrier-protein] dehydratase|nr:3-hydroxyacyl-ACP dehydratase FabZ [Rhodospirillales bacterium]MDP6882939.1 3-hydroxyacyl-ACP dehydratase FabZ [Rhodospirillales bacterium]
MDKGADSTANAVIEIGRVMEMIPHRYPFLMIDRIIETVPDSNATAVKNVTIDEPFFQGHFPNHPVMPGVLIVESMAQTAAILVVHTLGENSEGKLVYFTSIETARFRKPVTPGDSLRIHVQKERNRGGLWKFSGKAEVDGAVVAEATFSAMIMDD